MLVVDGRPEVEDLFVIDRIKWYFVIEYQFVEEAFDESLERHKPSSFVK